MKLLTDDIVNFSKIHTPKVSQRVPTLTNLSASNWQMHNDG